MERFETVLEARGQGVVLEVPFDVKEHFGRARAPVVATVNGFSFRTTVAAYGGRFYVGLNRGVREGAAVSLGDRVVVELVLDTEPRVVSLPADLAAALDGDPAARGRFDGLSYTHRREYVEWIEDAKREETRATRVRRTVEMLLAGVRTPH